MLLFSVLITSHLNQRRLVLLQERVDEASQTLQVYRPPIPCDPSLELKYLRME